MSFIYPRVVSIYRPNTALGIGAIDYQVTSATNETLVASNVTASIQYDSTTNKIPAQLPADNYDGMRYKIFMRTLTNGTIKDNDIIVDDEGIRYQVSSAYWNSLGYNAKCERLQN